MKKQLIDDNTYYNGEHDEGDFPTIQIMEDLSRTIENKKKRSEIVEYKIRKKKERKMRLIDKILKLCSRKV